MGPKVTATLIFLGGAACGAGVMWLGLYKHYRMKEEAAWKEANDFIDNEYRKKKGRLGVTEESKKLVEKANMTRINSEKSMTESYKETLEGMKVSYNTVSAPDVKMNTYSPSEDMPEEDEMRNPYIITQEEYNDVEPYYDKVTLLYNKGDSSLVDMQTEELMDISETIGQNVFEHIDKFNDFTYIYVRNDQMSTDYEVEIRNFEEEENEA